MYVLISLFEMNVGLVTLSRTIMASDIRNQYLKKWLIALQEFISIQKLPGFGLNLLYTYEISIASI